MEVPLVVVLDLQDMEVLPEVDQDDMEVPVVVLDLEDMEVPQVVVQDLQDMELLVVVLDLQDMEVLLEVDQEDMEVQVVVLDQEGTEALEGFEVEEMEVLELELHFIFLNNINTVIEIHAMILFNNVEEHHSTLIPL